MAEPGPDEGAVMLYYLRLGLQSLGKHPLTTGMLIIAIGLGIGATMTMVTLVHVMSKDPAPSISGRLFYPFLDASPPNWRGVAGQNFTWLDAVNLLEAHKADKQAAMAGGRALIHPENEGKSPFYARGHLVTSEFFPMFEAPFQRGGGWSPQQDRDRERVVVLNGQLSRKLFGSANPLGASVSLDSASYRVVGVLSDWYPQPLFYGGLSGDYAFGEGDQYFVPLQTAMSLKMQVGGGMSCWAAAEDPRAGDQCEWLQFWVRLKDSEERAGYLQFLHSYWADQQVHGRMLRQPQPRLDSLMARLQQLSLVPDDVSRQLFLSQLFLGICLVNAAGLLLAKFLRMSPQISIRRALGAKRWDILAQLLSEALLVGMAGGVLGCGLTFLGLHLIRAQPDRYAQMAHPDGGLLLVALALAVCLTIVAAAVPAWRASRVPPALELKLQ